MTFMFLILTIASIIVTFQVTLWSVRYYRYKNILKCPAFFIEKEHGPILSWLFPLLILIPIIHFYGFNLFTLLAFFFSIIAGFVKAKQEFIKQMTEFLMREENLTYQEAKKKAKFNEKVVRWYR